MCNCLFIILQSIFLIFINIALADILLVQQSKGFTICQIDRRFGDLSWVSCRQLRDNKFCLRLHINSYFVTDGVKCFIELILAAVFSGSSLGIVLASTYLNFSIFKHHSALLELIPAPLVNLLIFQSEFLSYHFLFFLCPQACALFVSVF